jgi:hypothetical protein
VDKMSNEIDFSKFDEYETNLEIILDMFMINANKVHHLEEAMWLFNAALSVANYQKNKFFEHSLGGTIDWIEVFRDAQFNNKDKISNELEQKAMSATKLVNRISSFLTIGYKPTTALVTTIGAKMSSVSKAIGNTFHDAGLFGLGDYLAAEPIVMNPMNRDKLDMIMSQLGIYDMDINSLSSSNRRDTDMFMFNTKGAYAMLRWGDWVVRAQALAAQMLHDGVWDAYSVENGVLKYDETKDKRFDGSGRFTLEEGIALKDILKTEMSKAGHLTEDGKLTRAYDTKLILKHKDVADTIFGGMDKELRGYYNYHWFGKLLGIFRTWLPSRIDALTQRPGEKLIAGDYKFVRGEDGKLYPQWQGLQVEGLIYTMNLLRFNTMQMLKGAETKPLNAAQKSNVARMITDFSMIAMGLLISSAIGDDENDSKLDEETANVLWRSLQDVIATYNMIGHATALFNLPVGLSYLVKLQDTTIKAIKGDLEAKDVFKLTPWGQEARIIGELLMDEN